MSRSRVALAGAALAAAVLLPGPGVRPVAAQFLGGVFVAAGRVTGAATADIVTGAGPGGGPHVRVFTGGGVPTNISFFAYDPAFAGGVRVAACDVDGDGLAEIITGAGPGGGPHVRVWKVTDVALGTVTELLGFFAYDPAFLGGVFVACGELNGVASRSEIVTGADAGGGAHVRIWRVVDQGPGKAAVDDFGGFLAYLPQFAGGARVAVLEDQDQGDGLQIVTGPGPGATPSVRTFKVNAAGGVITGVTAMATFFAYDPAFQGGVYVAAEREGSSFQHIVTAPGAGGGPHIKRFKPEGNFQPFLVGQFNAYDPSFTGGVTVAVGDVGALVGVEIVTGTGPGSTHVRAFRSNGVPDAASFLAY
jgi:hypothetical protein